MPGEIDVEIVCTPNNGLIRISYEDSPVTDQDLKNVKTEKDGRPLFTFGLPPEAQGSELSLHAWIRDRKHAWIKLNGRRVGGLAFPRNPAIAIIVAPVELLDNIPYELYSGADYVEQGTEQERSKRMKEKLRNSLEEKHLERTFACVPMVRGCCNGDYKAP